MIGTINRIKGVYYRKADPDAMYPHVVFNVRNINTGDLNRFDYELQLDIWDKSGKSYEIEEIADEVENIFKSVNLPQRDISPTFYTIDRKTVDDEDKEIEHRQIYVIVQLYDI